ncbi:MAG: DUF6114 domain-containing protein [Candidatus Bathyarchaeia archaeon]
MVEEKPTTAYILSLIGGVMILVGGLSTVAVMGMWRWGMMHGWNLRFAPTVIDRWTFIPMMFTILGLFGAICGIIVIVGSHMLKSRPEEHFKWGTMILIFSVLSIFGGVGGFVVGLILGVVGGALAISWKPR